MHRIPVRDIMHAPVITIQPDALVADAAELMEEKVLRRLPVVNEDGLLVGIVTDADVREAEAAESTVSQLEMGVEEEWLAVADIMAREVATIDPNATVGQLVTLMIQHKVGGIPVVEPGPHAAKKLIGIVTETDIFEMIADRGEGRNECAIKSSSS
ncbi:MAG: CBS domain-containing protein [Caldilineaceae bacterium]